MQYFFQIQGTHGTGYVRRRRDEAYKVEFVIPTVKLGGGSIMVWAYMPLTGPVCCTSVKAGWNQSSMQPCYMGSLSAL